MTATERAIALTQVAARAADSKQGDDLVALDVSGPLPLTDVFLLVTGRNERNVQAIASEVEDRMIEAGAKPLGPIIDGAKRLAQKQVCVRRIRLFFDLVNDEVVYLHDVSRFRPLMRALTF